MARISDAVDTWTSELIMNIPEVSYNTVRHYVPLFPQISDLCYRVDNVAMCAASDPELKPQSEQNV